MNNNFKKVANEKKPQIDLSDYGCFTKKIKEEMIKDDKIIHNLKILHQTYHSKYPENRYLAQVSYVKNTRSKISVSEYDLKENDKPQEFIFIHIPKTGGNSCNNLFRTIFCNNVSKLNKLESHFSYIYMIDSFFYNSWEDNVRYFNFPLHDYQKGYYWKSIPLAAISGDMYKNKTYFDKYSHPYSHIHLCLYDMSTNSDVVINNIDYYFKQSTKIFMMLREPIERLISEYYYFLRYVEKNKLYDVRNEYLVETMLKSNSFHDYIHNTNCHNYQLAFIYGKQWQKYHSFSSKQINYIKQLITEKKIYVGILEYPEYNKRLFKHIFPFVTRDNINYFNYKLNENKGKYITKKDLNKEEIKYLTNKNKDDYEIYNFALTYLFQNYKI
jgi:hypothetical protein